MDILALDQRLTLLLNGSASLYWDHVAWIATSTIVWFPVALVLCWVIVRSGNMRSILLFLLFLDLAILLADQVASGICKPLFARPRPARSLDIMYAIDVVNGYRGGQYGFFSSHAANTMAVATFLSLVIRYRRLTFHLMLWVLLNCWTRVYLGVHYVSDLAVGLLWGAVVGVGLYYIWRWLTRRLAARDGQGPLSVSIGPAGRSSRPIPRTSGYTAGGYAVPQIEWMITTLLATYLFISVAALIME